MWQIDSKNITNYNASRGELQSMIIFWVLASGKTAKTAEKISTANAEATVKDRERILSILDCTVAGQEGIAKEAIISGISAGEFAIKMVQSIQETGKSALSRLASADKKASQVDSSHDLEDEVAMSPADKAKIKAQAKA
jgi:hypothetical protein